MKRHLFEPEQDMYVQNIGNIQNFFNPAKNNFGQAGHISIWVRSNGEVWADSVIAGDHGHWKQVASRTTAWRAWTAQWAKSYKTVWWWKLYFFCEIAEVWADSVIAGDHGHWNHVASRTTAWRAWTVQWLKSYKKVWLWKLYFFCEIAEGPRELAWRKKNRLNTTWPHGPSLYYISKRTGWVGLENDHFCWRAALYLCW